ncbi:MAG: MFS transporter [Pseudolabrys sp.]
MSATASVTSPVPHRVGLYLAVLQFLFTTCWTVYAIFLPKLAASAGIAAGAIILLLMLDQAIFTVADFATGIAADKVSRVLGRLGFWVAGVTLLSCLAFVAMPYFASAGAGVFIALTVVWAITSSALRAPPLMLLGKYAAKPAIPYLSSLALFGIGVAGAIAPYLTVTLREQDPRLPFVIASVVLVLTTFGLTHVERILARQPAASQPEPAAPTRNISRNAVIFALALVVLALGFQLHFAINSAPMFRRAASAEALSWLMPVFWIGFNLAMFPAGLIVNRIGHYPVMGVSALIGAAAIVVTALAQSLELMVVAQFAAGAAWGCILMAAFTLAFAVGENGHEGAMSGLLFSTLALATFIRMGAVAAGLPGDPTIKALLAWAPAACWTLAGIGLFVAATSTMRKQAPAS